MAHWRGFLDADARGGRYLPWKEVARATGHSRTTAWRLQKRDDFPAPYSISPGRVGYREDEVEAWRASRAPSSGRSRAEERPYAKAEAPQTPVPDGRTRTETRASDPLQDAPQGAGCAIAVRGRASSTAEVGLTTAVAACAGDRPANALRLLGIGL